MGSLVTGSTAMKTLFLTLLIITTVNLLKAEGVVNAYDEYGAVVDAFKPKTTAVEEESTGNATQTSADTCNTLHKWYIEEGTGSKYTSAVRASPKLECEDNGPSCVLTFSTSHTETATFSASISAEWKGVIGATIGGSYSKSTTYTASYSCELSPGQCAYVT